LMDEIKLMLPYSRKISRQVHKDKADVLWPQFRRRK
jgi:hypothetical protein